MVRIGQRTGAKGQRNSDFPAAGRGDRAARQGSATFAWPTSEKHERWLAVRDHTPIAIPSPSQQLGSEWDFYRVFEAIEESE